MSFSRRDFVKKGIYAGALAIGLTHGYLPTSWDIAYASSEGKVSSDSLDRAIGILKNNPSIDLHSHLGLWETKDLKRPDDQFPYQGDDSTRAIIDSMIKANCKSAWVNFTSDIPIVELGKPGNKSRDFTGDQAWQEYERQYKLLMEFSKSMPIEIATRPEDIDTISAKNKLAVFLSTEGGHMIENDLDRLDIMKKRGLTKFQPMHYVSTKLGDNQTNPAAYGGLSPLGKESIKKAQSLGLVIDVAHASFEAAKNMIDISIGPVILSHTMMKYGPYLENRPRFISKNYAFMVAKTGGVVGTWTVGEPYGVKDLPSFVEAVNKLVDTIGIDHVGWSTDYITVAMPDWFSSYEQFPTLCAALLDGGFSDQDLKKFIGGNMVRVFKEVEKDSK